MRYYFFDRMANVVCNPLCIYNKAGRILQELLVAFDPIASQVPQKKHSSTAQEIREAPSEFKMANRLMDSR
jgi:hypothetical protein